ncbi:MAG: glutathione S-transferase [Solirubrobacteraceae bacterium]|jgi:glutathione S-transferase|nr:glutathione S-transferase [Solirubrobacteraceae bacterium]
MEGRLYVVHGSHPCETVKRAMEMKGIPYKLVELPPPLHAPIQRLLFGERTVPALRLNGEKLSGSRRILRRLEELRPDPPLFPADAGARARQDEAESWGDEVFQPIARRLLWHAMRRNPGAMVSYSEHAKVPLPAPMIRMSAPLIARGAGRLNHVSDEAVRADYDALPGYLDKVDGWIEAGVLGGEQPNAADLQIATTLRLLMTLEDLRPLIEDRPAGQLALRLFPQVDGRMPAGAYPV